MLFFQADYDEIEL